MQRQAWSNSSMTPRSILWVLVGIALSLGIIIPATSSNAGPATLPASGELFGAFVQPGSHTGPDRRSALESFETLVGRKMAMERVYYLWDQPWPTADDAWTRDAGRIPYISWNARMTDRSTVRWADIASGVYDPLILARAADLIAFGGPVIFSLHPEPENAPAAG